MKTAFVWVKFTILVDTRLSFFVILYQRINEHKHIIMRRSGLGRATKQHVAYIIIGNLTWALRPPPKFMHNSRVLTKPKFYMQYLDTVT